MTSLKTQSLQPVQMIMGHAVMSTPVHMICCSCNRCCAEWLMLASRWTAVRGSRWCARLSPHSGRLGRGAHDDNSGGDGYNQLSHDGE
jgi:hypothetical protein